MDMLNTPTYIYDELRRRGVEVEVINETSGFMRYMHNGDWHYMFNCVTEKASMIARFVCNNKYNTEYMAAEVGFPLPASQRYTTDEEAIEFLEKHKPIVVKPVDGTHGRAVTTNITSKTHLKKALAAVRRVSNRPALLQKMVKGQDLRILVIGGKFTAAVRRVPATVIGDGKHTVEKLIEIENEKPTRSKGRSGRLKVINIEAARSFLKRYIGRVPKVGEVVYVSGVSNTSMGGHAEDATDDVPEEARRLSEEFVKQLRLPVCGIDIMLDEDGSYNFIEANSSPGFGPHHHPLKGKPRDVTKTFVDYLLS